MGIQPCLPPLLPAAQARPGQSLAAQVRGFGAAGFSLVLCRGDFEGDPAARAGLEEALDASCRNGGWPALAVTGFREGSGFPLLELGALAEAVPALTPEALEAKYREGRPCLLAPGIPGRGDLWRAQRLRWAAQPPLAAGRSLVLTGGSGSGKSTLARALGQRLGLPVLDLDERIASLAGKSIPRIFAEDGEPVFRAMEAEAAAAAFRTVAVLALGGGAWESEGVRRAAREAGADVLWIAEDPARVWRRVAQDPGRPLARDREAFLARWRQRMPRWLELPAILPLGRTPSRLAALLARCAFR